MVVEAVMLFGFRHSRTEEETGSGAADSWDEGEGWSPLAGQQCIMDVFETMPEIFICLYLDIDWPEWDGLDMTLVCAREEDVD